MKTLIVKYLPRGNDSFTHKLLESFLKNITGKIKLVDLLEDIPDFFDSERVAAYLSQNYGGITLNEEEKKLLNKMERFATDVAQADKIILATPMHNFSCPGIVKAWFDSVMLKDITWTIGENGYQGLSKGNTGVLLFASGGKYSGERAVWNNLTPLVKQLFAIMGFTEFHSISAEGMNSANAKDIDTSLADATAKAEDLSLKLYK